MLAVVVALWGWLRPQPVESVLYYELMTAAEAGYQWVTSEVAFQSVPLRGVGRRGSDGSRYPPRVALYGFGARTGGSHDEHWIDNVQFTVLDAVVSQGDDCNGNGIPDLWDLGNGRSEDCNGDGVPDECEPD